MKNFYLIGIFVMLGAFVFWLFSRQPGNISAADLPEIVNGKQIVKMSASGSGYSPNRLKIRAGIPVVWEITSVGNPGCASALVAPSFFSGMIALTPNSTVTQEFTAAKPGTYRFSCSMGMYTGSFEVVN